MFVVVAVVIAEIVIQETRLTELIAKRFSFTISALTNCLPAHLHICKSRHGRGSCIAEGQKGGYYEKRPVRGALVKAIVSMWQTKVDEIIHEIIVGSDLEILYEYPRILTYEFLK